MPLAASRTQLPTKVCFRKTHSMLDFALQKIEHEGKIQIIKISTLKDQQVLEPQGCEWMIQFGSKAKINSRRKG